MNQGQGSDGIDGGYRGIGKRHYSDLCLIGILPVLIEERRDLILEDVKNRRRKKSPDLKNCLCGGGVDRCLAYREDLKELQKALHISKCKHIPTTILASFKDDP